MEGPAELLDTSIAIERREGVVTVFTLIEYPRATEKDFEVLIPQPEDFTRAVDLSAKLFGRGTPVPAVDVLIASMALNRSLTLLARDKHFHYIRNVEPEFRFEISTKKESSFGALKGRLSASDLEKLEREDIEAERKHDERR